MVFLNKNINIKDIDENVYKVFYCKKSIAKLTNKIDKCGQVILKDNIILLIYDIDSNKYDFNILDIEKMFINLRNFLISTNNKDKIKFSKIAIEKTGINNIEWRIIENIIKEVFRYTNIEIIVCGN